MQTTIARGSLPGRRGVREIALIGALYVFYCMTRTLADGALGPAQDRAGDLLTMERVLHVDDGLPDELVLAVVRVAVNGAGVVKTRPYLPKFLFIRDDA